ncbi:MAG TPA: hypothetical protein VHU89_14045 [Acidobacteriaceae bacterium]|nr:hypothetical protein [Acidobacteriaceae bacterium]
MPEPLFPAAIALVLLLAVLLAFGFGGEACRRAVQRLPVAVRIALPALLAIPWTLVAAGAGHFHLRWFMVYLLAPVAVALVLEAASRLDPEQRGHWLDFLVLLPLGLAVDLRWLEAAWPAHLTALGKLTLLDAGLYGLMAVRQLSGVGFDLRLRGARRRDRSARVPVLRAHCHSSRPGSGVSALASARAPSLAGRSAVDL